MATQEKTNSTPKPQPPQGGADRPGQRPNESQERGESQSKGEPEKHGRQGQGVNKTPR
jgi:hypothetical protein